MRLLISFFCTHGFFIFGFCLHLSFLPSGVADGDNCALPASAVGSISPSFFFTSGTCGNIAFRTSTPSLNDTVDLPARDRNEITGPVSRLLVVTARFFSSSIRNKSARLSRFITSVCFASSSRSACVNGRVGSRSASRNAFCLRLASSSTRLLARSSAARADAAFVLFRNDVRVPAIVVADGDDDATNEVFPPPPIFATEWTMDDAAVDALLLVLLPVFRRNAGSTYLFGRSRRALRRSSARTADSAADTFFGLPPDLDDFPLPPLCVSSSSSSFSFSSSGSSKSESTISYIRNISIDQKSCVKISTITSFF